MHPQPGHRHGEHTALLGDELRDLGGLAGHGLYHQHPLLRVVKLLQKLVPLLVDLPSLPPLKEERARSPSHFRRRHRALAERSEYLTK